jgi:hydroxymethylbilane synthase
VRLVYATRRSALALAQSRALVRALQQHHPSLEAEELTIVTSGDRIQDRPLSEVGGKGLFVKEIEEALLEGRADFAVHSMKDVPADVPAGLVFTCIPEREDARDALVCRVHEALDALPQGATVGTSSLRRAALLGALRPDLDVRPLRGNIDTRLRKLDSGDFDAIVLAVAGLNRLGLGARVTEALDSNTFVPAISQGAIGVECRSDDERTKMLFMQLHSAETATCVAAERGVMTAVGGDCKTPVGAYATRVAETLELRAFVASVDLAVHARVSTRTPWPQSGDAAFACGRALGANLLEKLARSRG